MVDATEFDLRYEPRAGLLPELTRQTYSSVEECIREAVLNSSDAGASHIEIDLTGVPAGEISVRDNGHGMTRADAEDAFLALGGSRRFGEADKHGRIGIGSLAMLQLGLSATVKSRSSGAPDIVILEIDHQWALDAEARGQSLREFRVGTGFLVPSRPADPSQFTEIRVGGLRPEVVAAIGDPSAAYRLIDRLRVLLPLPFGHHQVLSDLETIAPRSAADLRGAIAAHSLDVTVLTPWGQPERLTRRLFGDSDIESSAGPPAAIDAVIRAPDGRTLRLLGFMLAQERAIAAWSGLTARHQNVAVEEHTFFDLDEDPGFRRYITGEVHVLGDALRADLITIDRRRFSRSATDYPEIQRVMHRLIRGFKVTHVQRPRRERSSLLRLQKKWDAVHTACAQAVSAASERLEPWASGAPASAGRHQGFRDVSRPEVHGREKAPPPSPSVYLHGRAYAIRLGEADAGPPVVIRARPREVRVNLAHPLLADWDPSACRLAVALEICALRWLGHPHGSWRDDVIAIASNV